MRIKRPVLIVGRRAWWWRAASVLVSVVLSAAMLGGSAAAAAGNAPTSAVPATRAAPAASKPAPGPERLADPGAVLPAGWRHSADEAVTVVGDATGLHVLAASEASGYTWRSVTALGDPAVQTSLWIGQACVTASGRYAVVVYAPEQVTNMAGAQGLLARAAVVNLRTGAVRELGDGFSIAYFDPGCGTGSQAVLTEGAWADDTGGDDTSSAPASMTLAVVNAEAGTISATVRMPGQVTSAVPYAGQIVAAAGAGVEEITYTGKTRLLAATPTVPYRLTPDAGGCRGTPGTFDAPVTAQPSTTGTLAVTVAEPSTAAPGQRSSPGAAQPVAISAQLLGGSRRAETFGVPAPAAAPAAQSAAAPAAQSAAAPAAQGAAVPAAPHRMPRYLIPTHPGR